MMADSHHERSNTWFQEVFPNVFPRGLRRGAANPRQLKVAPFVHGEYLAFSPEEVRFLSGSMLRSIGKAVEECSAFSASATDTAG
jgi:hypothetical protein